MSTTTVTRPSGSDRGRAPRSPLVGTGHLIRLALRRDRIRLPVWCVAVFGMTVSSASSLPTAYPTDADVAARASFLDNPASTAMFGAGHGLESATIDNIGPLVIIETSTIAFVLVSLMSVFMAVRHGRAEEEAGRADLVRAGVIGRHAALAAGMVLVGGTNLLLGALIGGGLAGLGLPAAGSMAYGLTIALVGVTFGTAAMVAAQASEHSRTALGLAGSGFALAFVLRATGDVTASAATWFSPLGWAQEVRPYAGDRWAPLLLLAALAAVLGWWAATINARRDVGAGLLHARPGRSDASDVLGGPLGLALRTQRAALLAWTAGITLAGIAGGILARRADEFTDVQVWQDYFAQDGTTMADQLLGFYLPLVAMLATAAGLQVVGDARSEERAGRAETVLVAGVPRHRWALAHATVALGGATGMLALAGLAAGLASGPGQVARVFGATLMYLPAVALVIGFAVLLLGVAPRGQIAARAVLGYAAAIALFGPVVDAPEWMTDLSPFTHLGTLLPENAPALPALGLALAAAALVVGGLATWERRDLAVG